MVGIPESMCGQIDSDPPHLASPPTKTWLSHSHISRPQLELPLRRALRGRGGLNHEWEMCAYRRRGAEGDSGFITAAIFILKDRVPFRPCRPPLRVGLSHMTSARRAAILHSFGPTASACSNAAQRSLASLGMTPFSSSMLRADALCPSHQNCHLARSNLRAGAQQGTFPAAAKSICDSPTPAGEEVSSTEHRRWFMAPPYALQARVDDYGPYSGTPSAWRRKHRRPSHRWLALTRSAI